MSGRYPACGGAKLRSFGLSKTCVEASPASLLARHLGRVYFLGAMKVLVIRSCQQS